MSLTAIEYQIYSYVKNTYSNMYMIIAYSLSIYDKRLFQLIWQGSGASNSEINIFILIFFIFAQWPVLMYNPCIVLSMYLNRIVNLLTLTRANFDLGNSLTYFAKVHIIKSCGELFYYCKVASTNKSRLEAHSRFYRRKNLTSIYCDLSR